MKTKEHTRTGQKKQEQKRKAKRTKKEKKKGNHLSIIDSNNHQISQRYHLQVF